MKIDLPLETWVATFESLSRKQLAALLPHIGDEHEETKNRPIGDRQFVKNVLFYLHKCGDVTLGQFSIQSSRKGPVFVNNAGQELLLAEVPLMPLNIKSFKEITINYYDRSVLDFLQQFRRNSLLTNVHLLLSIENRPKFDAISKMMTQLLPSITSIESLMPWDYEHNIALFQDQHSEMMESTRILTGWSGFIIIIKLPSAMTWQYVDLHYSTIISGTNSSGFDFFLLTLLLNLALILIYLWLVLVKYTDGNPFELG